MPRQTYPTHAEVHWTLHDDPGVYLLENIRYVQRWLSSHDTEVNRGADMRVLFDFLDTDHLPRRFSSYKSLLLEHEMSLSHHAPFLIRLDDVKPRHRQAQLELFWANSERIIRQLYALIIPRI